MRLALYAPGLGYYSAGATKFGGSGDFVTAPEISSLFSRCLARQCADVLRGHRRRRARARRGLRPHGGGPAHRARGARRAAGAIPHPRSERRSRRAPARAHRAAAARTRRARAVVRPLAGADHARRGAGQRSAGCHAGGALRVARPAGRHRRARARRRPCAARGSNGARRRRAPELDARGGRHRRGAARAAARRLCVGGVPVVSAVDGEPRRRSWSRASRCSSTTACRARTCITRIAAAGTLRCHFRHRAHDDPFINVGPAGHHRLGGLHARGRSRRRRRTRSAGIRDARRRS